MNRSRDWLGQAQHDLRHARNSRNLGDFSWACFAAQQAAEKAVKAVYLARNMEGWGHVVRRLLEELQSEVEVSNDLIAKGRRLDVFYIPTRYPNGFDEGKPADFFAEEEADQAIADAEAILQFCKSQIGP